eukprot:GHVN01041803.1.p1 GENE.GHVN01041803.1~~GHVN01041803.1.p1  ORF type:complete len:126 (+),score=24.83 GHVN01041803.1:415-792(+)
MRPLTPSSSSSASHNRTNRHPPKSPHLSPDSPDDHPHSPTQFNRKPPSCESFLHFRESCGTIGEGDDEMSEVLVGGGLELKRSSSIDRMSLVTWNAGLLDYRLCGCTLYQNPPFTELRLAHIPRK